MLVMVVEMAGMEVVFLAVVKAAEEAELAAILVMVEEVDIQDALLVYQGLAELAVEVV
jgi:hypothetical protein